MGCGQVCKDWKFWVLIIAILFVIIAFIGVDVDLYLPNAFNENEKICVQLDDVECLDRSDICSLCAESIEMSFSNCHSKEFCEGIGMFDPKVESIRYVQSMKEYVEYNGRDLKIVNFVPARCMGCYHVEIEFLMDSVKNSSVTDKARVNVTISNWEFVEVVSSFEGLD